MKQLKYFKTIIICTMLMLFFASSDADAAAPSFTANNPYDNGVANCTATAWQCVYNYLGIAMPAWQGSAKTWYDNAAASGFAVGSEPRANSVVVYTGEYGHVAYVSQVSGNQIFIMEGGHKGGYNECSVDGAVGSYYPYDSLRIIGYIYFGDVHYLPQGCVDVYRGGVGAFAVSGWAFDRDNVNSPVSIHVYIDDTRIGILTANEPRTDVNGEYPGVGDYHGFSGYFTTSLTGSHRITVWAIDIGGDGTTNVKLGSEFVTITECNHNWGSGKVTKEPSCTEKGVRTYTCSACGKTTTKDIPADGHKYVDTVVLPAVDRQGYTLHECSVCQYRYFDNYTDVPEKDGPVITDIRIYNVTREGYDVSCKVSDESGILSLWGDSVLVFAWTDDKDFYGLKGGKVIGENRMQKDAATGEYTKHINRVLKDGDEILRDSFGAFHTRITAKDIYYNETQVMAPDVILREDACTVPGDHDWGSGSVTKAATSTTTGVRTYTCSNCQATKTEEIPATGSGSETTPQEAEQPGSSTTPQEPTQPGSSTTPQEPTQPGTSVTPQEQPGTGTDSQEQEQPGTGTDSQEQEQPGAGTDPQEPEQSGTGTTQQEPEQSGTGTTPQTSAQELDNSALNVEPRADQALSVGTVIKNVAGGNYKVTGKNTVEFTKPSGKKKSVNIPDTITVGWDTYQVTAIAANAFNGNKKLTSVTIGRNIRKIGANAFRGCKNLKQIYVDTKKLKKGRVGKKAFAGINKKAVFKISSAKVNSYKKIFKSKGAPSTAKYKFWIYF